MRNKKLENETRLKDFMKDLTEISKKHDIVIDQGSPPYYINAYDSSGKIGKIKLEDDQYKEHLSVIEKEIRKELKEERKQKKTKVAS